MEKRFFLILLFVIPIIGFTQMRKRLKSTDLDRYELKGNVKQVIHKEYEPVYLNDSTYKLKLSDFFLIRPNYKLEFNKKGNLKTKIELEEDNDSLITDAVWEYKYDSKNRILQELRISNSYKDSKDTITWDYKYIGDSIINIRQQDDIYKNLYYSYKEKDNFEYFKQRNSDSSYVTKSLFVYDKQNRLIRFEDYEDKDYIQYLKLTTYKSNSSKNKFKEIMIWTKYDNNSYREYEYDENGNIIIMKMGNFIGSEPSITRYQYVYDKRGNWVEKKQMNEQGNLLKLFRREIEYYE